MEVAAGESTGARAPQHRTQHTGRTTTPRWAFLHHVLLQRIEYGVVLLFRDPGCQRSVVRREVREPVLAPAEICPDFIPLLRILVYSTHHCDRRCAGIFSHMWWVRGAVMMVMDIADGDAHMDGCPSSGLMLISRIG